MKPLLRVMGRIATSHDLWTPLARCLKRSLAELNNLRNSTRATVRRRLDEIAVDPFAKHANVKRYKEGGPDSFRLRHGQWRAIYRIDR